MLFLLIFPVLVAGFVACHIHPVHSYRLHRYEGQYLYLKSAELGLKCFFFAWLAALAMHHLLPDGIIFCCRTFSWKLLPWLIDQMVMVGATARGKRQNGLVCRTELPHLPVGLCSQILGATAVAASLR